MREGCAHGQVDRGGRDYADVIICQKGHDQVEDETVPCKNFKLGVCEGQCQGPGLSICKGGECCALCHENPLDCDGLCAGVEELKSICSKCGFQHTCEDCPDRLTYDDAMSTRPEV